MSGYAIRKVQNCDVRDHAYGMSGGSFNSQKLLQTVSICQHSELLGSSLGSMNVSTDQVDGHGKQVAIG